MTAFSAAVDAIFGDPNMAADAAWTVQGRGVAVACRVITKRPDDVVEFGAARIATQTTVVDVRVSEVATPTDGDWITIGSETFVVQGKPIRDRERLVWTVELLPWWPDPHADLEQ